MDDTEMSIARSPAFRIETPRLVLRCFRREDAPAFRALIDRNNQHLRPWIPWMRDEPMALPDTAHRLGQFRKNFVLKKEFRYAVLRRDNKRMIGLAGLHTRVGPEVLEIGYLLDRGEAGNGFALETSMALVRVAFELHRIARVEIHCAPENRVSARIPEKLGFEHETTREKHTLDSEGVLRDSMVWRLAEQQYTACPAAALDIAAYTEEGIQLM